MVFEEWKHTVIEHVRCNQCVFAVVQFSQSYLAVGINKGLLINATQAFDGTNIVSVLRAQVTVFLTVLIFSTSLLVPQLSTVDFFYVA